MLEEKRSLKERKRVFDERHPTHSFRYVPKNLSVFGQEALSITIGCSRKPPPPPEDFPGPGTYEIKPKTLYVDIPHRISTRPETSYATISSGIDFPPLPPFGRPQTRIANRSSLYYFDPTDGASPAFCPKDHRRLVTISAKVPTSDETAAPGPGKYPIVEAVPAQVPAYSVPKSKRREIWAKPPDAPPPGSYEVIPALPKPKRWASRYRVEVPVKKRISLAEQIKALTSATGSAIK
jgi:hypothetical protein